MPQHHQPRTPFGAVLTSQEGSGGGPSFDKPGEPQGGPSFEKPAVPAAPPQGFPPPQPAATPVPAQPQPGGFMAPPPAPPAGYGQPYPGGAPAPTYELSGWWARVGATIIDSFIVTAIAIPLILIGVAIGAVSFTSDSSTGAAAFGFATIAVLVLIYVAVALIYAPWTMSKFNGATLGKKALGIRVVRVDGLPMTFGSAAVREIAIKQLLIGWVAGSVTLGLAGIVNYLWPLWDAEHRALHDMLAKTRVVRG